MEGFIQLAVCVVLWGSVIICAAGAGRSRRRHTLWFLITFAVAMTLMPEPIYDVVDRFLGSVNTTYFLYHAIAIVAVGLLDLLVQEAVQHGGVTKARRLVTAGTAAAIIVVQAAMFFGSDWRLTENFNLAFYDRWDYTIYASTTWFALAFFAISVGGACLRDVRNQQRPATRVSLLFVAAGCFAVLAFAVISLTNASFAVTTEGFDYQNWARPLYFAALLLAPTFIAVGLGLTAAVDGITHTARQSADRRLLLRITPLWERLLAATPEYRLDDSASTLALLTERHPGARLYRRYVEIRDSLLLRPGQVITAAEIALIECVERRIRATTTAPLPTPKPTTEGIVTK